MLENIVAPLLMVLGLGCLALLWARDTVKHNRKAAEAMKDIEAARLAQDHASDAILYALQDIITPIVNSEEAVKEVVNTVVDKTVGRKASTPRKPKAKSEPKVAATPIAATPHLTVVTPITSAPKTQARKKPLQPMLTASLLPTSAPVIIPVATKMPTSGSKNITKTAVSKTKPKKK
jgi:hypothetical protein